VSKGGGLALDIRREAERGATVLVLLLPPGVGWRQGREHGRPSRGVENRVAALE
jgi:hypothetical protein